MDLRQPSENKVNLSEPFMRAQSIFLVQRLSRLRVAAQSEFSLGKAVSWMERNGEGRLKEGDEMRQKGVGEKTGKENLFIARKAVSVN